MNIYAQHSLFLEQVTYDDDNSDLPAIYILKNHACGQLSLALAYRRIQKSDKLTLPYEFGYM